MRLTSGLGGGNPRKSHTKTNAKQLREIRIRRARGGSVIEHIYGPGEDGQVPPSEIHAAPTLDDIHQHIDEHWNDDEEGE